MVSFFLSGKQLHWSLHNLRSSISWIFIYHTTTWLDPGRVFGCIYNWAGIFDTGGLLTFSFWFLVFFFGLFGFIRKEEHAAMHDARLSPRQKLPFGFSIPRHFDSISSLFRHTEASRNTPYTTNIWIPVGSYRLSLRLFPWLCSRLTNDLNDDLLRIDDG